MLAKFKTEVCERSEQVDPGGDLDWYGLSIGFFLACGATPDQANDLAIEARYTHKYWC